MLRGSCGICIMCRRFLRRCSVYIAALQIGRREDEPFLRRWYWLFVPAALLIGGILTNDWH